MQHYSGKEIPKCICCGEKNLEFLTIDHINNCGDKRESRTGYYTYSWLKRNNYPEGFQVLCYNCNLAKYTHPQKLCPAHHPELYPELKYEYIRPKNECEVCGKPMPLDKWIKSGLQLAVCSKECRAIKRKKRYFLKRKYYKEIVWEHYGGKCICCGETNPDCLTIDHLIRVIWHKKTGYVRSGTNLYSWLITHNYPEGFQLMCSNCNQSKRYSDEPFCKIHHPELYQ